MKSVSSVRTHKAILECLKVVSFPPGDNVCKWYIANLSKEVGQFDSEFLFLYDDEAVFSNLMTIKWLNEELYDKILPLLGGSHTLLVKLKILHKNYGLSAMKDWWVDSSVVAIGSTDKATIARKALLLFNLASQAVF